ncbi:hypothetical protein IMZ48_01425 [Candidatus Bathyarchaeota archaeon]|nr:hypothetical protein [Candidatus Bathyarchaeota archaeon]
MCTERISLCEYCGHTRHISWDQCTARFKEMVMAQKILNHIYTTAELRALPRIPTLPECRKLAKWAPAECEARESTVMFRLHRRRACPNEWCASHSLTKEDLEAEEEEELRKERKDSGISGVEDGESDPANLGNGESEHANLGNGKSEHANIGNGERPGSPDPDCAILDESESSLPPSPQKGAKNIRDRPNPWGFYHRGTRKKPLGPNIKYAPDYVAIGDHEIGTNPNNMKMSYAVHSGPVVQPLDKEKWGDDIVRPGRDRYAAGRNKSTCVDKVTLRESIEPDETYLWVKQWWNIPEFREQYAEMKRLNPGHEMPLITVASAVEDIFDTSGLYVAKPDVKRPEIVRPDWRKKPT